MCNTINSEAPTGSENRAYARRETGAYSFNGKSVILGETYACPCVVNMIWRYSTRYAPACERAYAYIILATPSKSAQVSIRACKIVAYTRLHTRTHHRAVPRLRKKSLMRREKTFVCVKNPANVLRAAVALNPRVLVSLPVEIKSLFHIEMKKKKDEKKPRIISRRDSGDNHTMLQFACETQILCYAISHIRLKLKLRYLLNWVSKMLRYYPKLNIFLPICEGIFDRKVLFFFCFTSSSQDIEIFLIVTTINFVKEQSWWSNFHTKYIMEISYWCLRFFCEQRKKDALNKSPSWTD